MAFARFEGSLSGPDKDAAIADFRDQVPVLLCTESGGEGRNIQFCNTLINFDVPWNPMAIEQRIGRIDRIGQQREVFVFNLVTRGTLEEQVLALLEEKISMFELVVGEVGAILGGLEEEREFPDLVLDAWLETTEAAPDRGLRRARPAPGRGAPAARGRQGARRRAVRRGFRDGVRRADDGRRCAISSPSCWRARALRSSRWSRTGSRCWRRSRCAPPWAGRSWRGSVSAPSCRTRRCRIGLEGDWLDRFGASARRARPLGRAAAGADRPRAAAPGDPERLLDRALDLPNAVWRLHGVDRDLDALPAAGLPLHRHLRREARGAGLARLQPGHRRRRSTRC